MDPVPDPNLYYASNSKSITKVKITEIQGISFTWVTEKNLVIAIAEVSPTEIWDILQDLYARIY